MFELPGKLKQALSKKFVELPTIRRYVVGSALALVPVFIFIGLAVEGFDPLKEATAAIVWFGIAACYAGIAILVWEEVNRLTPTRRLFTTAALLFIVFLSFHTSLHFWVIPRAENKQAERMLDDATKSAEVIRLHTPVLHPQNTTAETSGTQDTVKVEVQHPVGIQGSNEHGSPNNDVFADFVCDMSFMFIDVPKGASAHILTLRDNLTTELVNFSNTDADSYRWPPCTDVPSLLMDDGKDCAITNLSKETFLNGQADFIVEFDTDQPVAVVKRVLHTIYIDSLEPGKSYVFHVINQSRFFTILSPPDKFPTHLLGKQQPQIIAMVRRNRSAADFAPIGLFRSKYKWQGNKVIGVADAPR